MNGPPPPKGVVGTKVKVQVTSLHHDKKCCTVWGARYKTTFAPGVVTAYAKEASKGGRGRLMGYVTAEYLWSDGTKITKKTRAGAVDLAPDDDPVHQQQWVLDARARANAAAANPAVDVPRYAAH